MIRVTESEYKELKKKIRTALHFRQGKGKAEKFDAGLFVYGFTDQDIDLVLFGSIKHEYWPLEMHVAVDGVVHYPSDLLRRFPTVNEAVRGVMQMVEILRRVEQRPRLKGRVDWKRRKS